jgi:hypothetical protein
LFSSPTPLRKLPFGAVEREALRKGLRKKALKEQRFLYASAERKTSISMRTGPAEDRKPKGSNSLGNKILMASKPPRLHPGAPSYSPRNKEE